MTLPLNWRVDHHPAVRLLQLESPVDGTIARTSPPRGKGNMVYTLALDSTSWLATLTGEATITVYTNGNLETISKTVLAVGDASRFNGFLFKVNGALVLFANAEPVGPGYGMGQIELPNLN